MEQLYWSFLGRGADADGLAHYEALVASGQMTLDDVAADLHASPEGQTHAASSLSCCEKTRATAAPKVDIDGKKLLAGTVGVMFEETIDGRLRESSLASGFVVKDSNGKPYVVTTAKVCENETFLHLFDSCKDESSSLASWETQSEKEFVTIDQEIAGALEFAYLEGRETIPLYIDNDSYTANIKQMLMWNNKNRKPMPLRRTLNCASNDKKQCVEISARLWSGENTIKIDVKSKTGRERKGGVSAGDFEFCRVRCRENNYESMGDSVSVFKADLRKYADPSWVIQNNNFLANALRNAPSRDINNVDIQIHGADMEEFTNRKINSSSWMRHCSEDEEMEGAHLVGPAMNKQQSQYSVVINANSNNVHNLMDVRLFWNPETVEVTVTHTWRNFYSRPALIACKLALPAAPAATKAEAWCPKIRRFGCQCSADDAAESAADRELGGKASAAAVIAAGALIDTDQSKLDPSYVPPEGPSLFPVQQAFNSTPSTKTSEFIVKMYVAAVDPTFNISLLGFDENDCAYAPLKARIASVALPFVSDADLASYDVQSPVMMATRNLNTLFGELRSGMVATSRYYLDGRMFEAQNFAMGAPAHIAGSPIAIARADGSPAVVSMANTAKVSSMCLVFFTIPLLPLWTTCCKRMPEDWLLQTTELQPPP
jgi:hypothetical protein